MNAYWKLVSLLLLALPIEAQTANVPHTVTNPTEYVAWCPLWRTDGTFRSTIRLANHDQTEPISAVITLYMADGIPYQLDPVRVPTCGITCIECQGFTGTWMRPNSFTIQVGKQQQLNFGITDSSRGDINLNQSSTWTSYPSSIATVQGGLANATSAGSGAVSALSNDGYSPYVPNMCGTPPDCGTVGKSYVGAGSSATITACPIPSGEQTAVGSGGWCSTCVGATFMMTLTGGGDYSGRTINETFPSIEDTCYFDKSIYGPDADPGAVRGGLSWPVGTYTNQYQYGPDLIAAPLDWSLYYQQAINSSKPPYTSCYVNVRQQMVIDDCTGTGKMVSYGSEHDTKNVIAATNGTAIRAEAQQPGKIGQ